MTPHRYTRSTLLPLVCVLGLLALGQTARLSKTQLPTVAVFTDTAQTFTQKQTLGSGLSVSGGTPASNGDIGWNVSTSRLEYRHNNTTSEFGSASVAGIQAHGLYNRLRIKTPNGANTKSASIVIDGLTLFDSASSKVYQTSNVSMTIDADISGAGGLSTGTFTGNLWYAVWGWCTADPPLIATTASVTFTFDASFTLPTAPTGSWVGKKLVGVGRSNAGGTDWTAALQLNDAWRWKTTHAGFDPSESGTYISLDISALIPPTVTRDITIVVGSGTAAVDHTGAFASTSAGDYAVGYHGVPGATTGWDDIYGPLTTMTVPILESQVIYTYSGNISSNGTKFIPLGFTLDI